MSLIGVGYFIVSASLHQFVTSSSSPEDPTVRHYCRPIVFLQTQSFCIQVSGVLVTVKLLFMQWLSLHITLCFYLERLRLMKTL